MLADDYPTPRPCHNRELWVPPGVVRFTRPLRPIATGQTSSILPAATWRLSSDAIILSISICISARAICGRRKPDGLWPPAKGLAICPALSNLGQLDRVDKQGRLSGTVAGQRSQRFRVRTR